jgi:hypothetical protein
VTCSWEVAPAPPARERPTRARKQRENRIVVATTGRNENKALTCLYKLLTKARHIAGMKPLENGATGDAEIDLRDLV